MGILDKHIKGKIRFQREDLIVYEPTDKQVLEIQEILEKHTNTNAELGIKGEIKSNIVRYLIRELTNIGDEIDELSDEEVMDKINSGDRTIKAVMRCLIDIMDEVGEDMQFELYQKIDTVSKFTNIINMNMNADATKEKFEKALKKKGLDFTFEEIAELSKSPEALEKALSKKSKPKKVK